MAPPSSDKDQGQGLDLLWGIAFIVLVALALWFFARGPILQVVFYIKLLEIQLISLFTNSLESTRVAITHYQMDPTAASIQQIQQWLTAVGMPLRYGIAAILIGLAALLYFTHPTLKFNHTFDMRSLRLSEKDNWPQTTPTLKEDLLKEDLDSGKWAMGMNPMPFAKKYGLLEEIEVDDKSRSIVRKRTDVKVIKDRAEQVFSRQLGPIWRGVQRSPVHARALMAIFAAHSNQDRDNVTKLIAQIALSSNTDTLDFSGIDEVLKKHYNSKGVQKAMQSHAYLYGVLASLLENARTAGVLSSSDFLWLKPLDRPMWYVVNTVGRRTCMSEIAGFYSHWLAEKAVGRKLTQPMVKTAVTGLELAIKEIVYNKEEVDEGKGK